MLTGEQVFNLNTTILRQNRGKGQCHQPKKKTFHSKDNNSP